MINNCLDNSDNDPFRGTDTAKQFSVSVSSCNTTKALINFNAITDDGRKPEDPSFADGWLCIPRILRIWDQPLIVVGLLGFCFGLVEFCFGLVGEKIGPSQAAQHQRYGQTTSPPFPYSKRRDRPTKVHIIFQSPHPRGSQGQLLTQLKSDLSWAKCLWKIKISFYMWKGQTSFR